ncbi:hypothetical protein BDA99DRAFT_555543 [Phascolomyces articulosus]|uniref:Uncharacterized protein n=1 Tax=Phascolomyces articulosus TaxID=60185 RepID=A0AAD5KN41_9FUNG|nr:hypothetical protein BDA99DRAFT_555543 [Phascolomyces articulosus]
MYKISFIALLFVLVSTFAHSADALVSILVQEGGFGSGGQTAGFHQGDNYIEYNVEKYIDTLKLGERAWNNCQFNNGYVALEHLRPEQFADAARPHYGKTSTRCRAAPPNATESVFVIPPTGLPQFSPEASAAL